MTTKRPTTTIGSYATTPRSAEMIDLTGGQHSHSVTMSHDEWRAINRLYGYKPEQPRAKPDPPSPPPSGASYEEHSKYKNAVWAHGKWTDPRVFMQAGANINAGRHAEMDGLRMLAWIARFVPVGEDPLKVLVQLAIDGGFDVDPSDVAWARDDVTEEEE